MKTQLLFFIAFLSILNLNAQTDGWYLYTKASEITKIQPDDVNADELHIATDIGYIKYNTSTNAITDFLNLTSQNPAIDTVKDIALDPTSNNIALTLKDGIAIYDGSTVTVYTYDSSDLSIGENTLQFYYLQVEYAKDGSLYIFKEDAFGYQKFNNGVFETETITTFKPKDIVENNAGTKVFFAGFNNGLWELEKSTTTWTNYTTSNSDLITNTLTSLLINSTDLLYIGGYLGLNTLGSTGVWNTYQENDPINAFPYNVFDMSLNEATGVLLLQTSFANQYYYGLTLVDVSTNTWTNYRNDGANCLDKNVYTACSFAENGLVYAAPQIFSSIPDIGKLVEFTPSTESCSAANINYSNAPVAVNSNVVTDFSIRKKTNGNLDIGFIRTFDFHTVEVNPTSFNGTFTTATTLTPSPGNYLYSVNRDSDYFIVEDNNGWTFVDGNNTMTSYAHNIAGYSANNTLKASAFDSNDGVINLIHKGFDSSFNYRVYKTQCNTATGTCSPSEEIFANDRDITKNISYAATEDLTTNEVVCVAVKTDASGNLKRTKETWSKTINNGAVPVWDEIHPLHSFLYDLVVLASVAIGAGNIEEMSVYPQDEVTVETRTGNSTNSNPTVETTTFDSNNDSTPDKIESINKYAITHSSTADEIASALVSFAKNGFEGIGIHVMLRETANATGNKISETKSVSSSGEILIDNRLPNDISVQKFEIFQYNSTEAIMVLLTNYGLLVKTGIDISTLTLSNKQPLIVDNDIKLTPNPSNNFVSFTSDLVTKIQVYDINGRKVLENKGHSISVKNLTKGIYIVKGTTSENITISKKLIKN